MQRFKPHLRVLLSVAMSVIGLLHFVAPEGFVRIVPQALPSPLALVYVSGFFEIAGGVGLLIPRVRRLAGLGLVLLYIAVFPANINMALHQIQPAGMTIPVALMWLRLPFQILFIVWAWWASREDTVQPREAMA
jgi:uncharacterized membrane protein